MKINQWSRVWELNQYYLISTRTSTERQTRVLLTPTFKCHGTDQYCLPPTECKQQWPPVERIISTIVLLNHFWILSFRLGFLFHVYKLLTWKETCWHCRCVPFLPPSPLLPQGDSSICTLAGLPIPLPAVNHVTLSGIWFPFSFWEPITAPPVSSLVLELCSSITARGKVRSRWTIDVFTYQRIWWK